MAVNALKPTCPYCGETINVQDDEHTIDDPYAGLVCTECGMDADSYCRQCDEVDAE